MLPSRQPDRKVFKVWTFINPESGEEVVVSAYREKTISNYGMPSIEYGWIEEWPHSTEEITEDLALSHPGGVKAFIERKFQGWEKRK